MDNTSEDIKTPNQNKVQVFVLTPDKVNQLGINLISQLKTTPNPSNELPSTSKSTSDDPTIITTVSEETSKSDKLGIIMKNKLSSILFKNMDSKLSINEETEVQNATMEVKKEINSDIDFKPNLNELNTVEIEKSSIINVSKENKLPENVSNEESSKNDKTIPDAEDKIDSINEVEKPINIPTIQKKSINIGTIKNKLNFQISTSGPENVQIIPDAEDKKESLNKIEKPINIPAVQEKSVNIGTIKNKLNFQISTSGPENVRLGGFKKSALSKNMPSKTAENTSLSGLTIHTSRLGSFKNSIALQSSSNAKNIELKNNKTEKFNMPDIEINKNIETNKPKNIQNTEKSGNIKILKIETIPADKNLVISPERLDSFKTINIITSKIMSMPKLNLNEIGEINVNIDGKEKSVEAKTNADNHSSTSNMQFDSNSNIAEKEKETEIKIETNKEVFISPKIDINKKTDNIKLTPSSTIRVDEKENKSDFKESLNNPKSVENKESNNTTITSVNINENEKPVEVKIENDGNQTLNNPKYNDNKKSNNMTATEININENKKPLEVKIEKDGNQTLTNPEINDNKKSNNMTINENKKLADVKIENDDNQTLTNRKSTDNKNSDVINISQISKINLEEKGKNTEVKTKINAYKVLTSPKSDINIKSKTTPASNSRKSGRVRKSTYSDKEYLLDIDLSRIDDDFEVETPEITIENLDKSSEKILNTSTPGPKKRGRPRKIKNITENVDQSIEDSLNVSTQDVSENIPVPKRKVGRPRKQIKLEDTTPVSTDIIETSQDNIIKKEIDSGDENTLNSSENLLDDQDDININLKRKLDDSEIECPRKKFSRKVSRSQEINEEMEDKISLDGSTMSDEQDNNAGTKKSRPPITEEQFKKAVETLNELTYYKRTNEKLKEDEISLRIVNRYYAENGSTCGKCNQKIHPSTAWSSHNLHTHSNLGWRIGEPEINLQDEKRVLNILHNVVKNTSKKTLSCEKCGIKKKSALGLISHFHKCQKSPEEILSLRVTCTLCNKSYNRSCIKVHLATYHTSSAELNKLKLDNNIVDEENPVDNEDENVAKIEENNREKKEEVASGRKKRRAAEKAINLIQEVVKFDEEKFRDKVVVSQQQEDSEISDKRFFLACRVPDNPKGGLYATGLLRMIQKEFRVDGQTKCKFKDCDFIAKTFEEIKEHTKTCSLPYLNDYICRLCHHTTKTKEEFIEHLMNNHKTGSTSKKEFIEEESDEDIGDELKLGADLRTLKSKYYRSKGRSKIEFINTERDSPSTQNVLYTAAYRWTLELHENNFSSLLFENAIPDKNSWNLIQSEDVDKYLPVTKTSMDVETVQVITKVKNNQGTERNWKKFSLFETEIQNDSITIYCGGPIWSIAWVPTPDNNREDQYLAVSCLREHDRIYLMSQTYSSSEMIQFWNFGSINIHSKTHTAPKLEFCLAHEHGNIWCMEFCPSGCYNKDVGEEKLPRLGLLALACSDGSLPIYSIPLYKNDSKEIKILKAKPTFSLILNDIVDRNLGLWPEQVLKVSWSKIPGHNVVAAGYSNGLVGLWNLDTKSPLLRKEENGVTILKPFHIFKAHDGPVTALCFNPFEGGKKWLFTGSHDKYLKYWNLEDTSHPNTVHFKHIVSDACWLSHWVTTIVGYDDSIFIKHTNSTVQAMRNFMCDSFSATPTNSPIMSLSANDWGNQFAQSNYAGELVALFFHQLLAGCDSDKTTKFKRLLISFVDLVDKTLAPEDRVKKIEENLNKDKVSKKKEKEEENSNMDSKDIIKAMINKKEEQFEHEETSYSDASNKYGLVFNHMNMDKLHTVPELQGYLTRPFNMKLAPVMMYPLTSINRTSWNPNKQAFLYIASAYNAGFIRLQCVRHMNCIPNKKNK